MAYFRAIIRKIDNNIEDIIHERQVEADNKEEVKKFLLNKYPQFFQNQKIYSRKTKDEFQFFYVVIYPLFNWEIQKIEEGEWSCSFCSQVYENKHIHKPRTDIFLKDLLFCRSEEDYCLENYKKEFYKEIYEGDNPYFVKENSESYIYKITEKKSGKCYIGKTKNAPFFRWWQHLTKSYSPFGIYLSKTKLDEWIFEVIEIIPSGVSNEKVLEIESKYIVKFNSIENGFNSVISNKNVC